MTSLTDMWVPSLCVADMWALVNVDRSTVNIGRVQTGPVGLGYGLDLGRAWPTTWHADVSMMSASRFQADRWGLADVINFISSDRWVQGLSGH